MDDVLTLIQETYEQDENGVRRATTDRREVFCQVHSVTRAEFFEGGRNGLNPSFEFTVFYDDYEGESIVEYRGKQYGVYRAYRVPDSDYLELYVERKGGTNRGQESWR